LIVEDDLDVTHLLRLDLQDASSRVSSAASMMKGWMIFHEVRPDLILLDRTLLNGDGRTF